MCRVVVYLINPERYGAKAFDAAGLHEAPVYGPELVELVRLYAVPELLVVLLEHVVDDLAAVLERVRLLDGREEERLDKLLAAAVEQLFWTFLCEQNDKHDEQNKTRQRSSD